MQDRILRYRKASHIAIEQWKGSNTYAPRKAYVNVWNGREYPEIGSSGEPSHIRTASPIRLGDRTLSAATSKETL